jgi:hypothetical protein
MMSVYSKNHDYINALCGQNANYLDVRAIGTCSNHFGLDFLSLKIKAIISFETSAVLIR